MVRGVAVVGLSGHDSSVTDTEPTWQMAWEPLTPRGVAAFAGASLGRLLFVQLLVAMLAAASVAWFLETGWFPIVRKAIHELPAEGSIANGELSWSGETPQQLAQNRFLGLAVDLYHSGQLGREAHLQIEFGGNDLRVYSLLDYKIIEYPPSWNGAFNRTALEPWWGAWQPWLLVGTVALVVAGLMVSWTFFAILYCAPVRLISFLENRDLNWGQSWRLAAAANMPGALFLTAGIIAYSLGWMDLIRLGAIFALHFVVAWVYLFVGPYFCPRNAAGKKLRDNPFAAVEEKKGNE